MRAWKTLTAVLLVLTLGMTARAEATSIPVGVLAFDTFVSGPDGTNAFFLYNFTGDPGSGGFALPPDFPVVTPLVFTAPLLEWTGPAGSPFNFGNVGIGPGAHDPEPQIQFPDSDLFTSARFTALLNLSVFQLADGRFFSASSTAIDISLVNPAGALAIGDFAVLTIEADEITEPPPSQVPEPATLTLVATALAGIWRAQRAQPRRRAPRSH
jgi:hypothetical protein